MGAFKEYIEELDEKIELLKRKKIYVPDIEILRLIYMDLGQKMNFDSHYTFGNKAQKQDIYNSLMCEEEFDKLIKSKEVICKSLAYMLNMILPRYGIKSFIEYQRDERGRVKQGAHVYNIVELQDGKRFIIDLVEDFEYIQTGSKTRNFAMDVNDELSCLYSESELRRIDQEIGYIPEGLYMEDVLGLMNRAISGNISDDELFEFVLDNLNKYRDISNMGYVVRCIYYERMIESIFNEHRLDCNRKPSLNRIEKYDCYRLAGEERQYVQCFITNFSTERIYLFNNEKNCFERISIEQFARYAQNGLEVPDKGRAKKLKRAGSRASSSNQEL